MTIAVLTSFVVACTQTHSPQVTQATSGVKIVLNGGRTGQIRHFKTVQNPGSRRPLLRPTRRYLNTSARTLKVLIAHWNLANTETHSPEVTQSISASKIVLNGGRRGFWNHSWLVESTGPPSLSTSHARVTQLARETLSQGGTSSKARLTQAARELLTIGASTSAARLTQQAREILFSASGAAAQPIMFVIT